MRLRWKKKPTERGLRAVGCRPRGYVLHDGEKKYASVSPLGGGYFGPVRGWYWVAGWDSDVPYANTSRSPSPTVEEAKSEAKAHVDAHLTRKEVQP